jgi:hypothetical protein
MPTKELTMESIRKLSENAPCREIGERIRFLFAIEKACDEVQRGRVIPHAEVPNLLNG